MSFFSRGLSAVGKLVALGVLLAVFFGGMVAVIIMSLQGAEIKVPDISGKSFVESEHELAALGLKIKKRADRVSQSPPNTVIEQKPAPGETVKTGQWILVVTSKAPGEGEEPAPVLKKTEDDDASKIEDMISDKPKKPKSNANSNSNRKKADTTRDLVGNEANSNSNLSDSNSNKKDPDANNTAKPPSNKPGGPGTKPSGTNSAKPNVPRSGDTRPRTSNRP